jgi:prophage regulatory protein
MAQSFIRLPTVQSRTGWSRSSIYLGVNQGTFPKPISLGGRAIAWIDTEIDEWIENRIAASRPSTRESGNRESSR